MNGQYYREMASDARAAADAEPLVRRRAQHELSAERWEEMARAAEETAQRTAVNAEEKRLRPYHQTLRASARRIIAANNGRQPR